MAYMTEAQQRGVGCVVGCLLVNMGLIIFDSGWWIFALPISGFVGLLLGLIVGSCSFRVHKSPRGIEAITCIVTAGDEKKPCTLIIRPDRIVVEMGTCLTVPLTAITGLLFQQMTILTGFGIDYTDGDGKARLMFVNDGEFQANRTRKILKAIQDAMVAMQLDAPDITDISRAIKTARESVVHRV